MPQKKLTGRDLQEFFMREAIRLSRKKMQENAGGPFGAVIVRNGEIIAQGWNRVTSCDDPTAHAEIVAIRQACQTLQIYQLDGCEIYSSCEPCPMCLGAIYWARLDRLYFANNREDAAQAGFDDAHIYRELLRALTDRTLPVEQLLREEAQLVFKEWDKKPDKTMY